jgi:hypothetical protein
VITGITSRAAITIGHSNAASMRSLLFVHGFRFDEGGELPPSGGAVDGFRVRGDLARQTFAPAPLATRSARRCARGARGCTIEVLGFALDRVGARPFAA